MIVSPPAEIGMRLDEVETPALLLDLHAFEPNLARLAAPATAYGVTLDVLVEINVGGNRCGVEPGAPALALVEGIAKANGLRFRGLQAYHGSAQHIADYAKRRESVAGAIEKARETRDLLAKHGYDCTDIDGAGTGSYEMEGGSGVYNELQVGSYVFMDAHYARNLDAAG